VSAGGRISGCCARRGPTSEAVTTPNYLQRVVTSGARTRPSADPPLAIAPPLPALGPPMTVAGEAVDLPDPSADGYAESVESARDPQGEAIDVPEPPAEAVDSSRRSVSEMESPHAPPPAVSGAAIDRPPRARAPEEPGTSPAPRPRADSETVAHLEGLTRSNAPSGPVIRAPRGLRPGARVTAEAPAAARENTPPSRTQAVSRPSDIAARPGSWAPASAPDLAYGPGTPTSQPSRYGEASRGAEAADDSRSDEIERGRPRHREPALESANRAPATAPEARGLLATPSATPALVAPGVRERESRLTIGRIDVEVHNEPPPAPPPPTASRVATSRLGGRLASRFLLKS